MRFLFGNVLISFRGNSSSDKSPLFHLFDRIMPPKTEKRKSDSSGTSAKAKKAKQEDANAINYTEDEKYVFFFGKKCVFSQFHPATFVEGDLKFNCMEQYMHYYKAVTFKDKQMQNQIMASEDPLTHKKLGRKVSNFDPRVWGSVSLEVVKRGSKLKYNQNAEMKRILYSTYPKQLVEASPRDRLWGVGMGQSNPKIHDSQNWRGKNLLGKVLTGVRDELMKADGVSDTDKGEKEESDEKIKTEEKIVGQSSAVKDESSKAQKETEQETLKNKSPEESPEKNIKVTVQAEMKIDCKKLHEHSKSEVKKEKEENIVKQETEESKSAKKRKLDEKWGEQQKKDDSLSAKKRKLDEKSPEQKKKDDSLSMKKRKLDESVKSNKAEEN